MRRFNFKLQTLLRIRQRIKERVKQEYLDQLQRVEDQCRQVDRMLRERHQVEIAARAQAGQRPVDIEREKAGVGYLQSLQLKISRAREKLAQLQKELERSRRALIKASQAVKVLEKLRERRYAEYAKAAQRKEQGFLDEVGVQRCYAGRNIY